MIHTIFSAESTDYLNWQSQLLYWTHRDVKQPGKITRLLHSNKHDKLSDEIPTFLVGSYNPDPKSKDFYPPYNKPGGIMEWVVKADISEETILIVDPDCAFIQPIEREAQEGHPWGHHSWFMEPKDHPDIVSRFCMNPPQVQPVAVPLVIHRLDLEKVAGEWLTKTRAIRNHRASKIEVNWVAEMWGYTLAAAELGLKHELAETCFFPNSATVSAPVLHYSYAATAGAWKWDKREWVPGKPIKPPPPQRRTEATVCLLQLLSKYFNALPNGF